MKKLFFIVFLQIGNIVVSQVSVDTTLVKPKSIFWSKVQFGGGIGANFGNGFSSFSVAPSALYAINPKVGLGVTTQVGYNALKNQYSSWIYGAGVFGLFNPYKELQLSVEFEQLRINTNFSGNFKSTNSWNSALFLGAGYNANGVVLGVRYNVLHNKNNLIYGDAFMPFVRVFF